MIQQFDKSSRTITTTLPIVCILLLTTLWLSAAQQPPATQPPTCTIAGKVLQIGTDQPAANFAISGYAQGPKDQFNFLRFTTDEQGAFRTTAPVGSQVTIQWQDSPNDSYVIDDDWLNQGNWQPIPRFTITRDRTDLLLRVKLLPTTQLTGHVVDQQGKPVSGAFVHLNPRLSPTTTDASGVFVLKGVPKGRDIDLYAIREGGGFMGFLAKRMLGGIAHIKAGTPDAVIKVAPGQAYTGQALTPDGLPAAHLTFTLMPKLGRESLYPFQQSITTDAAGQFSVNKLIPNATYLLSWNSGQDQNRDYDYGTATVDLSQLKPGDPIKFIAPQYLNALMGQVVNEKGEPIKDATITLCNLRLLPRDAWNKQVIQSDAKGEFVIPRLAAGNVSLRISAPSYKNQLVSSATDSIDFKAVLKSPTPTCQYRFIVVDEDSQPVKNAPIHLFQGQPETTSNPPPPTATLQTDAAGQARIELPADKGSHRAICDMEGRDIALEWLPQNEDAEIRLVAPKSQAPWKGRVLDEQGKPVAGATVQVSSMNLNADDEQLILTPILTDSDSQLSYLLTKTDSTGRFQFPRLSSYNSVGFNLFATGYVPLDATFATSSNPSREEKEFTLLTAGSVKGKVVLKATGNPPTEKPEMRIQLHPTLDTLNVNPDWTFSSDALAPDTYSATLQPRSAQLRKYVCATQPTVQVTARASADLLIELEEGIRIHGKLLDAKTDKPLSGMVQATLANTEDSSPADTDVQPDGSWDLYLPNDAEYQIRYLPAGDSEYRDFKIIPVKRAQPPKELIIRVPQPQ